MSTPGEPTLEEIWVTDTTTDSPIPLEVEGVGGSGYLSGITAISAGDSISLALMSGGNVYAWGYNQYGLLGNESTNR